MIDTNRIFIDANIFIAAAAKPIGGAARILTMAKKKNITVVSTRTALNEAERNIKNKMDSENLNYYFDTPTPKDAGFSGYACGNPLR